MVTADPGRRLALHERPVHDSLDALLNGAIGRAPFLTTDSKSGNPFERVVIDGEPHVVKYVHVDDDFTIRCLGDLGPRALTVWSTGLVDLAPDLIDHAIVGVARGIGRNGWGAAILMRDVEPWLVPPGDSVISLEQHRSLLGHCAGMAARAWGFRDDVGLAPYELRYQFFGPGMIAAEEGIGFPTPVPHIAQQGWELFETRAPREIRELIGSLRREVDPLICEMRSTPSTFLHGDWKLGNLGTAPDGRTILLDWSYPGEGLCVTNSRGIWRSTTPGYPSRKTPQSKRFGRRSNSTAWRRRRGGPRNSTCACSEHSSSSPGRRLLATITNSGGGATGHANVRLGCDAICLRGVFVRRTHLAVGPGIGVRRARRAFDFGRARRPDDLVLDIGAGTGAATRPLLHLGACAATYS